MQGSSLKLVSAGAAALAVALGWAAPAGAMSVFTKASTGGIACAPQSDGVRFCAGSPGTSSPTALDSRVPSFDDTPLDVNVTLPAGGGHFPLVLIPHGYGGSKRGLDSSEASWIPTSHQWAQRGYAVISYTDRGFGDSCGSAASRASAIATAVRIADPGYAQACQSGWIRLLDTRYEVRDTQYLAGLLVDDGLVDPVRVGSVGPSYGGGMSLMLATLHDRMMNPDGTLVPWTSPAGVPMRLAGAAPTIPWSDLTYSLLPNGRTLDYTYTQPNDDRTPIGIEKQSFVTGLYGLGQASGYYAPAGADPEHDLTKWYGEINAGEPYEKNPDTAMIFDQFARYRSPFHLLTGAAGPSRAPAPMLLSNGFTDDLFPADETVRYYNSLRALYPGVPVSLVYFDYGHQRGANKALDTARLSANIVAWFDRYVRGDGPDPGQYVQTLTQTCPKEAPSGGPFTTGDWLSQHPGAFVYVSAAAQTVLSAGGDPNVAKAIDPVAGGGDPCASTSAADESGVANYRLPAATGAGFTLDGAATIAAQLDITGDDPAHTEVVGRLWDVDRSGNQTLVARGLFRPNSSGPQVFQLHPAAWHFAAGHAPKLQLLGRDAIYARASNAPFQISASRLTLFLATRETSGSGTQPAVPLPLPPGAIPVPGVRTVPLSSVIGRVRSRCAKAKPKRRHKSRPKRKHRKHRARGARRHAKRRRARRRKAAPTCARRTARHKRRPRHKRRAKRGGHRPGRRTTR